MSKIGDRMIEILGGVSRRVHAESLHRAYEAGVSDGGEDEPVSGTTRRYGYRRAGAGGARDLGSTDPGQAQETAWSLWQSSPLAKRVLVIKRGYIVGGGIAPQAPDDPELQAILDGFWQGNRLNKELSREFTLQLFLFGEQCYPAFVRESDGRVSLGYIDPGQIETVVNHPENVLETWAVVVKEAAHTAVWTVPSGKRIYRIIRREEGAPDGKGRMEEGRYPGKLVAAEQATLEPWEAKLLAAYGLAAYSGSCFFARANAVSNQTRGSSDLLQVVDWIDQADETLFALAEREQMAGYFSWDVTLAGADEKTVLRRGAEIRARPPRKGSVNVHNDSETWRLDWPDLKQQGTIETYNALLTLVLGGVGFPRHWFGYGDETNRATAEAQGDPTWRSLEDDQALVQGMFLQMCEFARDQAEIAGSWQPGEGGGRIELPMPEMTAKDLAKITALFPTLAAGLSQAGMEGWIRTETAATAFARLLSEIGVEVNVTAELEQIAAEQAAAGVRDLAGRNGKLSGMLADDEKLQQVAEAVLRRLREYSPYQPRETQGRWLSTGPRRAAGGAGGGWERCPLCGKKAHPGLSCAEVEEAREDDKD